VQSFSPLFIFLFFSWDLISSNWPRLPCPTPRLYLFRSAFPFLRLLLFFSFDPKQVCPFLDLAGRQQPQYFLNFFPSLNFHKANFHIVPLPISCQHCASPNPLQVRCRPVKKFFPLLPPEGDLTIPFSLDYFPVPLSPPPVPFCKFSPPPVTLGRQLASLTWGLAPLPLY